MRLCVEVFFTFLKLGCISFGGPIAHIGYFEEEFVNRKKWLKPEEYLEFVSLCQFLPGPTSSQVGMLIGNSKTGFVGAILAWVGFTLPSAVFMTSFAIGVASFSEILTKSFFHGFKLVAVVVVAQAVWQMGSKLCYEKKRILICLISIVVLNFLLSPSAQLVVILLGGILGKILLSGEKQNSVNVDQFNFRMYRSLLLLTIFILLLILPSIIGKYYQSDVLKLFAGFYKSGALVFGGGHVVLPLLKEEFVKIGFISEDFFLAGYGIAQSAPGPLFSIAGFLGASTTVFSNKILCGIFCLAAIYLPSFLLIYACLPIWKLLKNNSEAQSIFSGINSAVVGFLLSAFYDPIWRTTILDIKDFIIAVCLFSFLQFWKIPVWIFVVFSPFLSLIL